MFGLSSASAHAVHALACLDGTGGRFVLARDLAECIGAPLPYLSKILHGLVAAGIVEAKRGYRGGFRLARPAESVTLAEIADVVEGPGFLEGCLLGLAACSDERACPLHHFWREERRRIRDQLEGLNLRAVAHFERSAGRRLPCSDPTPERPAPAAGSE